MGAEIGAKIGAEMGAAEGLFTGILILSVIILSINMIFCLLRDRAFPTGSLPSI